MEANLRRAMEEKASDIFIVAGIPMTFKKNGVLHRAESAPLTPADTEHHIRELYALARREARHFFVNADEQAHDDDFSFSIDGLGRFRANVFRQRGSCACVIRVISFGLPTPEKLFIPESVLEFAARKNGLVLVTGSAGSGKSTTLACIIDRINTTREQHIITIEEPIEYIHRHRRSIVTQREIPGDAPNYVEALKSALRESPDVILLGEMRSAATIEVAMTAAETGQLLFSTLHTMGAANAVDRVVDSFPADQQTQIRMQLSMVLEGVISQQLVPAVSGGQIPVFEVMHANTAVRNLIREGKTHQIPAAMAAAPEMISMDAYLLQLVRDGRITRETAADYAQNRELMRKKLLEI